MKRVVAMLLCIFLSLTACGTAKEPVSTLPPPTVPLPVATEPITEKTEFLSVSVPAVTERTSLDDDSEIFSYTYQHMELVLSNADVADRIILDFLNRVDRTRSDAERILEAAQNDLHDADDMNPYYFKVLYSPTRIDQGILSLFGTQSSYNGGMHGGLSCISVNYDLMTGDPLTLGSIMSADVSKDDYINLIISKLEAIAQEAYLYDDFEATVRERLGGDETRYEDFYFTNTGLCFFFSPYEIAPYSSGIISVEIPYNELPGLIYDGYFPPERTATQGSLHTGFFMETNMEQFTNMAEIKLATGEEIVVLYPKGTVSSVFVNLEGDGRSQPAYTVFAACEMSSQDAVVLYLSDDIMDEITISYISADDTQNIVLFS